MDFYSDHEPLIAHIFYWFGGEVMVYRIGIRPTARCPGLMSGMGDV